MTEALNPGGTGRWLSLLWAVLCFAGLAGAMDPNRALSQYMRDRWSVEQGFPGGTVYAIAETADGFLWIGAEKGLVRFDGLNFRLFNHLNSVGLPAGPVLDLAASGDGDLWIRMASPGVLRYRDGVFQNVSPTLAQIELPITAMSRQEHGDLLFIALGNTALKYRGGKLTQRHFEPGRTNFFVVSLAETSDGRTWLGTRDTGLFSLSNGEALAVPRGLEDRRITCLLQDGDKELWIGTNTGLIRWDGTKITEAGVVASLHHVNILSMTKDRDSNVWVGTAAGLVRADSKGVSLLEKPGGMPVTAVFEDREGNLWTGGSQGIERFRDRVFVSYSPLRTNRPENNGPLYVDSEDRTWFAPADGGLFWLKGAEVEGVGIAGLSRDSVYSISGGAGELWVGRQRGGLTHLVPARGSFAVKTYTHVDGLPQDTVYTVHRCRDGSVWAGTLSGGVSHFRNGHFTNYTNANGLASDSVSSILEGSDGTMWFATAKGLNAFSNDQWRVYTGREGMASGHVNCLLEGSNGILWIGTSEGLAFLRSNRVQTPAPVPEPLREEILGIAEDASGWLWITTSAHVLRVKRDKLLNGGVSEGDVREYGSRDGLLATEGIKRDRSVIADSHGRIWFSMSRGISVVDPARLTRSPVPAIVHIQSISADGSPVDLARSVRIPAISKRIIFAYTGLSLSAPERVKYRYMLDGVDPGLSAPTAATEAGYSNLRPGSYRFRVIASNADGLWNGTEAALPLEVDPALWQTWWFRLLAVLACASAIVALYRFRLRQLTRQLDVRFDERLAERTRLAGELHDTLLQTIQASKMVADNALDANGVESRDLLLMHQALQRLSGWLDQATVECRAALGALRTSTTQKNDLAEAFQQAAKYCMTAVSMEVAFSVEGTARQMHPIVRDEVYRIGYEAIRNACNHSGGSRLEVSVSYAQDLIVRVRDDGKGIEPDVIANGKAGHFGLPGMRERANRIGAQLRLLSRTNSGTDIELRVPGRIAFHDSSRRTFPGRLRDLLKPPDRYGRRQ